APAVRMSAKPSATLTIAESLPGSGTNRCNNSKVTAEAGTLPAASQPTMLQATLPRRASAHPPPDLVNAAKRRSVPTAVTGATPNTSTSSVVISEPPPTPVAPTTNPTRNPESE